MKNQSFLATEAILTTKGMLIVQAAGDHHLVHPDGWYKSIIDLDLLEKYIEGGTEIMFRDPFPFTVATKWRYMFCVSDIDESSFDWAGFLPEEQKGVVNLENHHYFCRYNGNEVEFCRYTTYTEQDKTVLVERFNHAVAGKFHLKEDPYTDNYDEFMIDCIERVYVEEVASGPIRTRRRTNNKKRQYIAGYTKKELPINNWDMRILSKAINRSL